MRKNDDRALVKKPCALGTEVYFTSAELLLSTETTSLD